MTLFKGYIKTANKRPLQPFKDGAPLLTLPQAKTLNEYAGVLATNTVLIDVDDPEQANRLLDMVEAMDVRCRVVKTTRGMHFYFLNDGTFNKCMTATMLAVGITADIKVGTSNSIAVLKFNGHERACVYDIFEDETYQPVPFWLHAMPIKHQLWGLKAGDGRNSALFAYILTLTAGGFDKEQCRTTLKLINDYVFKEHLSSSELAVVMRDESFPAKSHSTSQEFFDDKGKFLFNIFGDYLIDHYHVKRIAGQLHIYDNGVYIDGNKRIEHIMLEEIPNLSQTKRNEVLAYLDVTLLDDTPVAPANFIAFKNGILDIETNNLLPFSPSIIITNKIEHDYNPLAKSELLEHTLDRLTCGDRALKDLLEELTGYCFYRRNEMRKAFVLVGDKANGKSTFIAMLQTMVGTNNCSSLDLKELGDRFKSAELYRKLVNLGDDIDDGFISDTAIFKKLVSGDRISAERKGQDPFEYNNYSKFVFSANVMPRVKDKTGAVLDRLIVIPFDAHFSKTDPDYRPYIKYELCQEENIEALIALGVSALRRVLARKAFTESPKVNAQLESYDETNNPLLAYIREMGEDFFTANDVAYHYDLYHAFCIDNGIATLSKIEFSRQLIRYLPALDIKRIRCGTKRVKVFARK